MHYFMISFTSKKYLNHSKWMKNRENLVGALFSVSYCSGLHKKLFLALEKNKQSMQEVDSDINVLCADGNKFLEHKSLLKE